MVPVLVHEILKGRSTVNPGAIVILSALAHRCCLLCSTVPCLALMLSVPGLILPMLTELKLLLSHTPVRVLLDCILCTHHNRVEFTCSSHLVNLLMQGHWHHFIIFHAKQLKMPRDIV
jgi:hypothetical protein